MVYILIKGISHLRHLYHQLFPTSDAAAAAKERVDHSTTDTKTSQVCKGGKVLCWYHVEL